MEIINKNFFSWILIIIFVFFGFLLINRQNVLAPSIEVNNFDFNKIQYVKIAGKILKVDLALTAQEQEKGLSGRKELKEDEGMLFVFNHTGQYPFWMKNMNFNIDIIWIDENFRVVYIKKNASPESYLPAGKTGPEIFTSDFPAQYVLEVLAGFSEKNNLKVRDKMEFLSL
jgi:uncharacterized membrane protein (UPF0127 family)